MIYSLRYVGPEPDCTYEYTYDKHEDVFLHLAERAADEFGDCEMDFDDPKVQKLEIALHSNKYAELMEALNAFLCPMNGDYFEIYTYGRRKKETDDYESRLEKVFASVEKARSEWREWKDEAQKGE